MEEICKNTLRFQIALLPIMISIHHLKFQILQGLQCIIIPITMGITMLMEELKKSYIKTSLNLDYQIIIILYPIVGSVQDSMHHQEHLVSILAFEVRKIKKAHLCIPHLISKYISVYKWHQSKSYILLYFIVLQRIRFE